MFDAIAPRYDLLNRLLSAGIDRRWRTKAIASLRLTGRETVLDVCTGTADVALESRHPRQASVPGAARVLGVDFAGAMLVYGLQKVRDAGELERISLVRGDAMRLPARSGSVDAATVAFGIRNVERPEVASAELGRVLRPGGRFVHIGVHPCFCGGFADRTDPHAITIRPGYRDGSWTTDSWTDQGIRDKVGASHLPIAELLNAVLDAGFDLQHVSEGGDPTPMTLSVRARRSDPAEPSEELARSTPPRRR